MAPQQNLAGIAEQCEQFIDTHTYDPITDTCSGCGQLWACYPRPAAKELSDAQGWRTSSFGPKSGNRVQVKSTGSVFALRETHSPASPILVFSVAEWLAFTEGVRAGEFDE